mmetsp:Transcript_18938/g.54268  ORF Transcript_18938/g.54268 Transcript_18938/m.54268 type:complete len:510 (+) Transcript_18938:250-1779(+)
MPHGLRGDGHRDPCGAERLARQRPGIHQQRRRSRGRTGMDRGGSEGCGHRAGVWVERLLYRLPRGREGDGLCRPANGARNPNRRRAARRDAGNDCRARDRLFAQPPDALRWLARKNPCGKQARRRHSHVPPRREGRAAAGKGEPGAGRGENLVADARDCESGRLHVFKLRAGAGPGEILEAHARPRELAFILWRRRIRVLWLRGVGVVWQRPRAVIGRARMLVQPFQGGTLHQSVAALHVARRILQRLGHSAASEGICIPARLTLLLDLVGRVHRLRRICMGVPLGHERLELGHTVSQLPVFLFQLCDSRDLLLRLLRLLLPSRCLFRRRCDLEELGCPIEWNDDARLEHLRSEGGMRQSTARLPHGRNLVVQGDLQAVALRAHPAYAVLNHRGLPRLLRLGLLRLALDLADPRGDLANLSLTALQQAVGGLELVGDLFLRLGELLLPLPLLFQLNLLRLALRAFELADTLRQLLRRDVALAAGDALPRGAARRHGRVARSVARRGCRL